MRDKWDEQYNRAKADYISEEVEKSIQAMQRLALPSGDPKYGRDRRLMDKARGLYLSLGIRERLEYIGDHIWFDGEVVSWDGKAPHKKVDQEDGYSGLGMGLVTTIPSLREEIVTFTSYSPGSRDPHLLPVSTGYYIVETRTSSLNVILRSLLSDTDTQFFLSVEFDEGKLGKDGQVVHEVGNLDWSGLKKPDCMSGGQIDLSKCQTPQEHLDLCFGVYINEVTKPFHAEAQTVKKLEELEKRAGKMNKIN